MPPSEAPQPHHDHEPGEKDWKPWEPVRASASVVAALQAILAGKPPRELTPTESDELRDLASSTGCDLDQLQRGVIQFYSVSDVAHCNKLASLPTEMPVQLVDGAVRSDADLKSLARNPFLNSRLASLHLCAMSGFTVDGMQYLRCLRGVRRLSAENMREFFDADLACVAQMPGLQELDIHNTGITDAGLADLRDRPTLQALLVGGTKISDAGLAHIGTLPSLKMLDISENPNVTDAAVEHLQKLSQLRSIYVSGTSITEAGKSRLEEKLPGCLVNWGE